MPMIAAMHFCSTVKVSSSSGLGGEMGAPPTPILGECLDGAWTPTDVNPAIAPLESNFGACESILVLEQVLEGLDQ